MGSDNEEVVVSNNRQIKYSPYLENIHAQLLGSITISRSLIDLFNESIDKSPDIHSLLADKIFLGEQTIDDYPPLTTIFKAFMLGQDLDKVFKDLMSWTVIENFILLNNKTFYAEQELLDKELNSHANAYRENNAVSSSTFVMDKTIGCAKYLREVNEVTGLKFREKLDQTLYTYTTKLQWQKAVTDNYAFTQKDYFLTRMTSDTLDMKWQTDKVIWNLGNMSDYIRPLMNPGGFSKLSSYTEGRKISQLIEDYANGIGSIVFTIMGSGVIISALLQIERYWRQRTGLDSAWQSGGLTLPNMGLYKLFSWALD